ncbi:MAG TPA: mucoidy inhibitor MuiA family protein, partial [Myxococcus sp.]|nr:mucoidy inhibitor MuiA family protein [Myxococcus sp.]
MLVVPSILDAVTVHAEGALCTRLATVKVEDGRIPTQVRINGLPLSLRTGSLRAAVVQGPPGLAVRDIRPTFDVQLPPEVDVPAEQHALEEAQARLADIIARLEAVQREVATVGKLKPEFPPKKKDEQEPRDAPLAALLSLTSFIDSELAALHARRLDLERQRRDAEAQVQYRRGRLQEASSSVRVERARVYRAAVLTLAGPLPSEHAAQLALEYAVPGARWVPTYDLRLPRNLEEGTLRMRASVLQRTGEDWTGVRLSVSTADLDRRAEVSELKALRIGRRQPPPARSGWREPPPGLDELFAGFDTVRRPVAPEPPPPPKSAPAGGERVLESASELERTLAPKKRGVGAKPQPAQRAPMD